VGQPCANSAAIAGAVGPRRRHPLGTGIYAVHHIRSSPGPHPTVAGNAAGFVAGVMAVLVLILVLVVVGHSSR
jgi:hypothetical protein